MTWRVAVITSFVPCKLVATASVLPPGMMPTLNWFSFWRHFLCFYLTWLIFCHFQQISFRFRLIYSRFTAVFSWFAAVFGSVLPFSACCGHGPMCRSCFLFTFFSREKHYKKRNGAQNLNFGEERFFWSFMSWSWPFCRHECMSKPLKISANIPSPPIQTIPS